jgi:hypothetical protein
MVEQAIAGLSVINTWSTNSHVLTTANGTTAESRAAMLSLTDSGTALTGAGSVICPALSKVYIVKNGTAQVVTVKTASGTGIAVPVGKTMLVYCDGTNVLEAVNHVVTLSAGTLTITGLTTFASIKGTGAVTVTNILDEDNMASDSATALVTQQSVKAYVASQVGANNELSEILANGNTTGANDIDVDAAQKVQFRDAAIYINSSVDGQLDIVADTEIQIAATTVDINGAVVLDGAVTGATSITSTSLDITNNIVVGGTVDGRDVDTDGTKLDTVETNADVTDTANVTAAGALMDSEVTNLAEVKAFDSTDYATSTQGTTADDALPKAGGAMTGAITTNSTFDGRDVATDGTKLDTVETNADVTDTANVTAAGALMDSEVTNLAEVKAFDSTDYATSTQGTTADDALPKAGGAMTGAITTNSTFDGRDVATDGTKLDGIEALADVTDATNVAAAGALMKTGGAMTGAITTNSTFDGRDVATDGTKLDGIEALADVTDATNVTAAGALMDSELADIAAVKALDQGVATTDSPSFVNMTMTGTGSVKVPAGTTAQRDGTPANGMFRYNSTNEQFEGYQNSEWGSIGGGGGSNTFTTDTFTGDGTTTAYALSQVISSEDNLMVFIAGVFQQQSSYSIATASGTTTLTFSTAPVNTREIVIYSIAGAVSGTNLNVDSMTGDGTTVAMTLSITPVNENNTQVFIDGVYQSKSNYSISGTTLTFSTAPPNGTAVEVMTMNQTDINVPVDGTVTSAKLDTNIAIAGTLGVGGVATFSGDVGIGTSSPVSALDLSGGADGTIGVLTLAQGNGTTKVSKLYGTSVNTNEKGLKLNTYHYGDIAALTIASTGAATFSGDVTTGQSIEASSSSGGFLKMTRNDATIGGSNSLGQVVFQGTEDGGTTVTTGATIVGLSAATWTGTSSPGILTFNTTPSGSTTPVEGMRLSDGNLLVGSSSSPANRRLYIESVNYPAQMYATTAGINYPTLQLRNAHATGSNTCTQIDFRNAADASVGQVKSTASATIFATSSDYRLKEDDVAMTGAIERVKALRPINFAWKLDGSRVDGFFAHELAEVVPEAATGSKDAMMDEEYEVTPAVEEVKDEDGNVTTEAVAAVMGTRSVPDYQGIDQSKLVPLLTATIQELIARIEALEGA